ncbi:MAG: prepilin-type N-terminal cleavage/methylation domain-containing protein [Desulfobacterales bacterium]|jgi:prepilin-type N-terminal cleavage/methylation domain-containing protein
MRSAALKTFKWKSVLPGANQGFSLIEVLIAMAIFSIGILAVGSLVLSTTRNNTNGNILTQATMLARAKMEEKKRTADAGNLTAGDDETLSNVDMEGNPGGIYNYDCDIEDIALPGGNALRIQVTVSWTRKGQSLSVVLTTLY